MSRYDHALNKHPKTGIIKKIGDLFNGDNAIGATGPPADSSNMDGGVPATPVPIQGETGTGFDYGETGIGFGYGQGDTGLQGTSSASSSPVSFPLSMPADPDAFIRPITEPSVSRDARRDVPQSSSLNSMTPIVPSEDGSTLIGSAPGSLHFTLTGPGGYRAFVPVRNLDINVRNETEIIIRLSSTVVHSLIRDIEQNGGRGNIRRNGSL